MNEYKTLKAHFSELTFHNPYTIGFVDTCDNYHCHYCCDQILKDFPEDEDTYILVTVEERFGLVCEACGKIEEPDCGYPTDFLDFVETLQFQGWCSRSAKAFARVNINDDLVFEQAALHLKELMDIGDQEFGDCEQEISYIYELDTEDQIKVRIIYDQLGE